MIESLDGIRETVNFKANTSLRLYDNDKCEHYPLHWHTPIEIILVTQNTYEVTCNNLTYLLEQGDILIISPGTIHSTFAPIDGERLIFQADCSILHCLKEFSAILFILSPALYITEKNSPILYHPVHDLILKILEEYTNNEALGEGLIYSMLIQIFVLIGRNHTKNKKLSLTNDAKQNKYAYKFLFICDYINKHCTEDLTLDEISNLAGFSKFHFTRLFKEFTGVTFYKYLTQKRIAFAENLLIDPDISITEVALYSGFSSLSAFSRMFRIIKNCTPTEFRTMYLS